MNNVEVDKNTNSILFVFLYENDIIKELDIGDRVQFPMIEPSKDITSDNPKTAIQSSDEIVS